MTMGETPAGTAGDPPLRIGTAERESAAKALDEHLAAGRLGIEEYADRSAVAANATVASELAALFTDLPAPHPVLPGSAVTPVTGSVPATPKAAAAPARAGGGFHGWGPRIVAATPILAVILFFVTGSWLWFLAIPLMGALVYGGGVGRDDDGDGRRELRRERRELRAGRRDRRRDR